MPKSTQVPMEQDASKTMLPEVLTAENIAEMLLEAAEVDAFFQTGIPLRSRLNDRETCQLTSKIASARRPSGRVRRKGSARHGLLLIKKSYGIYLFLRQLAPGMKPMHVLTSSLTDDCGVRTPSSWVPKSASLHKPAVADSPGTCEEPETTLMRGRPGLSTNEGEAGALPLASRNKSHDIPQ